jgi:hypothetical protein
MKPKQVRFMDIGLTVISAELIALGFFGQQPTGANDALLQMPPPTPLFCRAVAPQSELR